MILTGKRTLGYVKLYCKTCDYDCKERGSLKYFLMLLQFGLSGNKYGERENDI
jgi:hypothetical protein